MVSRNFFKIGPTGHDSRVIFERTKRPTKFEVVEIKQGHPLLLSKWKEEVFPLISVPNETCLWWLVWAYYERATQPPWYQPRSPASISGGFEMFNPSIMRLQLSTFHLFLLSITRPFSLFHSTILASPPLPRHPFLDLPLYPSLLHHLPISFPPLQFPLLLDFHLHLILFPSPLLFSASPMLLLKAQKEKHFPFCLSEYFLVQDSPQASTP